MTNEFANRRFRQPPASGDQGPCAGQGSHAGLGQGSHAVGFSQGPRRVCGGRSLRCSGLVAAIALAVRGRLLAGLTCLLVGPLGGSPTLAQTGSPTMATAIASSWDDPYALPQSSQSVLYSSSSAAAVQTAGWSASRSGLIDQPIINGGAITQSLSRPLQRVLYAEPYRGRMFIRGEYLGWMMDGMDTPPLVTTNPAGTAVNQAGWLGGNETSVLFGGELNDDFRSGFRVRGGWYVDPSRFWAVGGDYYQLLGDGDSFSATSDGSTILARPFYNMLSGLESAQLIAYPARVRGSVDIDTDTTLRSFGIHVQSDAVYPANHPSQIANGCAREPRVDWIVGYRNVFLEDQINIRENLTALTAPFGKLDMNESFHTENQFQGIELGFVREVVLGRWWFEASSRVAVGNNQQKVKIAGSTRLTEAGVPETFPGGLYAQRTNIGTYERDRLTVVPELGATLGWNFGPHLSLNVGYTFVYIGNVVRAGDQIDTDVNPNLIPVETSPMTGPLRPEFQFRSTDFYAHGITVGGDIRF